jgi:hypothetical protein
LETTRIYPTWTTVGGHAHRPHRHPQAWQCPSFGCTHVFPVQLEQPWLPELLVMEPEANSHSQGTPVRLPSRFVHLMSSETSETDQVLVIKWWKFTTSTWIEGRESVALHLKIEHFQNKRISTICTSMFQQSN